MRDRIINLLKELKISQREFAIRSGLKASMVNGLLKGRTKNFSSFTVEKICSTFGVRPEWLLNGEGVIFKSKHETSPLVSIPLLGRIPAGPVSEIIEEAESSLVLNQSFVKRAKKPFALKVRGDSMIEAGIYEDDIGVFDFVDDFRIQVKETNIVAACVDGQATLKRFLLGENGGYILRAENKKYKDVFFTDGDIQIKGLLVCLVRGYLVEDEEEDEEKTPPLSSPVQIKKDVELDRMVQIYKGANKQDKKMIVEYLEFIKNRGKK